MSSKKEAEARFTGILKLAADSRKDLRASDVDRVLGEAHAQGCLAEFKAWVSRGASDRTKAEIAGWEP